MSDRNLCFLNNCPVNQRTADGKLVGRCWHYCHDKICPTHGDVSEALLHYAATGQLTPERPVKPLPVGSETHYS